MTSPLDLIAGFETPFTLNLRFVDVPIAVVTNDAGVDAELRRYYAPYVVEPASASVTESDGPNDASSPAASVHVIQGRVAVPNEFVDVKRTGARRVKEAVLEVEGGRLIRKTMTGVIMGLCPGHGFAVGDVHRHINQAINLVNACYAKVIVDRGYLMLHASAVTEMGRAVVLAGPPGAGKSTASLHLIEQGFRFLSNDRVLAKPLPSGVDALGYPKQPRVNPGTLLNHPRLASLLGADDRASLATLPRDVLRDLERKSDVDLDTIYGSGTVELRGQFVALVLLQWSFDGAGFHVRRLKTGEVLPNLRLIHKDLGVFDLDRPPIEPSRTMAIPRYVELLSRVTVVEVRGKVDLDGLADVVRDLVR